MATNDGLNTLSHYNIKLAKNFYYTYIKLNSIYIIGEKVAELQAQVKQPQRLLADVKYYLNHKHPISDLLQSNANNNQIIRWDANSSSWVVGYAPGYTGTLMNNNVVYNTNDAVGFPSINTIPKFSYDPTTNTISWANRPPATPDSEWLIQGTQDNMHTLKLKPSSNPASGKYTFAIEDINGNTYFYVDKNGIFYSLNGFRATYIWPYGAWVNIGTNVPLMVDASQGTFMKLKTSIPDFSAFSGWYLPVIMFYHDGVDNTRIYVSMKGLDGVVRTGYITVT